MGKTIIQSKVFWVFLILICGAAANSAFGLGLPLTDSAEWVIISLSFIAFILRLFTAEPIGWGLDTKLWYKSKVFWVAVLVITGAGLNLTGLISLPLDASASWITAALGVIVFVLRIFTSEPIIFKDK